MKTLDFKLLFDESDYLKQGFKFEVCYSRNRVARIYINERPTKYKAGGYGYDKESTVISMMINDLIWVQPYNTNIYGNRMGLLQYGVGFESIKQSFDSIDDYELNKIYSGKASDTYEIKFSKYY